MSDNMKIWDKIKQPPSSALKKIQGGRLKGMSDINPQWRYEAMTEHFGVCGVGWKFNIVNTWTQDGSDSQIAQFAQVELFIKQGEEWSDAIPSVGGSMFVTKEKAGLHISDEGVKMAVTDALGTAMKMLGMAADVYKGLWDGSKYKVSLDDKEPTTPKPKAKAKPEIAPEDAEGDLIITGLIEKVSTKEGKSAKGEWSKFGILIDGEWYGTFSKTIGQDAEGAKDFEEQVKIVYEYDGQYNTIKTLEVLRERIPGEDG